MSMSIFNVRTRWKNELHVRQLLGKHRHRIRPSVRGVAKTMRKHHLITHTQISSERRTQFEQQRNARAYSGGGGCRRDGDRALLVHVHLGAHRAGICSESEEHGASARELLPNNASHSTQHGMYYPPVCRQPQRSQNERIYDTKGSLD